MPHVSTKWVNNSSCKKDVGDGGIEEATSKVRTGKRIGAFQIEGNPQWKKKKKEPQEAIVNNQLIGA